MEVIKNNLSQPISQTTSKANEYVKREDFKFSPI